MALSLVIGIEFLISRFVCPVIMCCLNFYREVNTLLAQGFSGNQSLSNAFNNPIRILSIYRNKYII